MTFRVMVSAPYMLPFPAEFRLRLQKENVEIIEVAVNERLSESKLLTIIADFDGVICGDDQFTENVLRRAKRLKVISKWGTGIDSIDTTVAAKLGILVFNTPNAFTDAVADTTLGYILDFARRLSQMDQDMRRSLWRKPAGISLAECSLGVIGVGNIGKAVVKRARAFGMRIFGNDIKNIPGSFVEETKIEMLSLPKILAKSDFITLHCDLNPTSFHLIDQSALELMKPTTYLINTARGSLIDEPALIRALRENRLAGAALDVFEIEPLPPESPLRQMENGLLAPHNSNSSPAARAKVHESTIDNLLRGFQGSDFTKT